MDLRIFTESSTDTMITKQFQINKTNLYGTKQNEKKMKWIHLAV